MMNKNAVKSEKTKASGNVKMLKHTKFRRTLTIVLAAVLALCVFIFAGCSATDENAYNKDLEKGMKAFRAEFSPMYENFQNESAYSYTVEYSGKYMQNFDYDSRILPENKPVAEGEKVEKEKWINVAYTSEFTRYDATSWYQKIVYKSQKIDSDGMPERSGKKPIYKEEITVEYRLSESTNLVAAINGETIYSGIYTDFNADYGRSEYEKEALSSDIIGDALAEMIDDVNDRAAFSISTKSWTGSKILTAQEYFIKETKEGTALAFRDSENAKGFSEDLTFDWEKISTVSSKTMCYTAKKGKLQKFELYQQTFASNSKTTTQIWNNEETTKWNGDMVVTSTYLFTLK